MVYVVFILDFGMLGFVIDKHWKLITFWFYRAWNFIKYCLLCGVIRVVILCVLMCLQGSSNIANLTMDRYVVNPSSCHSTSFKYSLAGNNPGSLSLILQDEDRNNVRILWTTSQATGGWQSVSLSFRYWGRFYVSYIPDISIVSLNSLYVGIW